MAFGTLKYDPVSSAHNSMITPYELRPHRWILVFSRMKPVGRGHLLVLPGGEKMPENIGFFRANRQSAEGKGKDHNRPQEHKPTPHVSDPAAAIDVL